MKGERGLPGEVVCGAGDFTVLGDWVGLDKRAAVAVGAAVVVVVAVVLAGDEGTEEVVVMETAVEGGDLAP